MQRDSAITYSKALAIIFVVFEHSGADMPFVHPVLQAFLMPLFFFFAGYCLKEKYFAKPHKFIWNRIKGIWWPNFVWSVLFLSLHNFFFNIHLYGKDDGLYSTDDFISRFSDILIHLTGHEPLLHPLWFLPVLFLASIISFSVLLPCFFGMKKKYNYLVVFFAVLMLAASITTNYLHKTFTILYIGPRIFLASSFYLAGHAARCWNIPGFGKRILPVAGVASIVGSYFGLFGMSDPFYPTDEGITPYFIVALIALWFVYSCMEHVKGWLSGILEYIGNNSLYILILHYLSFKVVSLVIILVYGLDISRLSEKPTISVYNSDGWWVLYLIVGVSLPLGYVLIKNRINKLFFIR